MKSCKYVQETSKKVLFIKTLQIARQNHFYQGLMMKLDSNSTKAVSIENYEIRISRSDFTHIHVYLCRVSFLTTLNIYKDYFKGCHKWCNLMMHSHCARKLWLETIFVLVHHILSVEATASLRQGFCDQGVSWSSLLDELENFATNIFLKLVC